MDCIVQGVAKSQTRLNDFHVTSQFLRVNLCSNLGTSLVVQWLRLRFQCWDVSLIPGGGTRIPHATGSDQKKKKKEAVADHLA